VINHLKKEGVGFIYISHRYAEVYELGDRVTILRDGKNVGTFSIRDLTLETMIEKMIGGKIGKQYPSLPTPQEKIILRLENFQKGTAVLGIDFMLRKGEILGITGLMGAGKTELARAIAGVDPPTSGNLYIEDKKVTVRTPEEAIRHGISFLTENRKTEGVILDQSLRNNYGLPNINRLSPFGLVKIKKMNDEIDFYMKELTIKAPHRFTLAGQLSGGNQQKLVLAKWLGTHAKVILFDEPTRGIDIIGRREVYRIMQELLAEGTSIIMFTSDYAEAMEMSHRVMVMRRGKIVKEFPRNTASEDDILKAAIGVGEFR
jgi:ribose transport system ATP-binding protein